MTPPKLIEIPLGPFTSPTGPMNYPCRCGVFYHRPDPDCERCNGTGQVTGEYTPCQRKSSEDDRIKPDVSYLVRVEYANVKGKYYWCCGRFSKQWYGWSFDGWGGGGGLQLDSIEGPMYEICE
jgi:hypothetical protein